MSSSRVIWSSPDIDRLRKNRESEKSIAAATKSLKFQIALFFANVSEMCLNILWRLFGGTNSSIYLYKLICKTVLTINLLFIISYIYQIICAKFRVYLESRSNKTEPIMKSVLFDLVPQVRYYYEKIMKCKWLSKWLQKEALERERINLKLEEERRKTIFKMYLPSFQKSCSMYGNVNVTREAWQSQPYEESYLNSKSHNFNVVPNRSFNRDIVPLDSSTPYSNKKALTLSKRNMTYTSSPMQMNEERFPIYQDAYGDNHSNSINNASFQYHPSPATTSRMNVERSPLPMYPTNQYLVGALPELASPEVWRRLSITSETLDQWIMNLKQWLHGTIISRVSQEIDAVNQSLVHNGITDVMVGESNVQTLRQLASQPGTTFPTLSRLIDFLDCSKDQAYVVNRIKELSQGRCLGKFQWDAGSTGVRHQWKEHLPNDTMLVIHLMSTYIDSRVHSNLHGVRTFSQQFILESLENKDPNDLKDVCVLLQVNVQPPLFKIVYNQMIFNIAPGRRNLFECFLVFFYKVYKNEGNLKWLNLGRSGLNLNWIFDQTEGNVYQH